jgi:transposase
MSILPDRGDTRVPAEVPPSGPDTLKPDSGLGKDVLVPRPSKYPEQFRRDAVELARSSDRSLREIGRELGVNHETLRNWVNAAKRAEQAAAGQRPAVEEISADEREELRRLRKKVAELELEKEILRKAAHYVGDICQVPVASSRSMSPSKIFCGRVGPCVRHRCVGLAGWAGTRWW